MRRQPVREGLCLPAPGGLSGPISGRCRREGNEIWDVIVAVAFALAAAFSSAVTLITQHATSIRALKRDMGWRLPLYLVRQPLWLLGWGRRGGHVHLPGPDPVQRADVGGPAGAGQLGAEAADFAGISAWDRAGELPGRAWRAQVGHAATEERLSDWRPPEKAPRWAAASTWPHWHLRWVKPGPGARAAHLGDAAPVAHGRPDLGLRTVAAGRMMPRISRAPHPQQGDVPAAVR